MFLVITITNSPDNAPVVEWSKTFEPKGGTIGRSSDNDWVLPDPERYLSSIHARISYDNNQYLLTDTSTNGTIINGSMAEKGTPVPVNNGDQITLGDYVLDVQVLASEQPQQPSPFAEPAAPPISEPEMELNDIFSKAPANPNPMPSPMGNPFSKPDEPAPPLFGDKKPQPLIPDEPLFDNFSSSFGDQGSPMAQNVQMPAATSSMASTSAPQNDWDDDWHKDLFGPEDSAPATPEVVPQAPVIPEPAAPAPNFSAEPAATPVIPAPVEEPVIPTPAPAPAAAAAPVPTPAPTPASPAASGGDDRTLINTLGFAEQGLSSAQVKEINEIVGQVTRETVSGLMKILNSRTSIKSEFRINVTTIQPVENNPLKFSANVDDALENMFLKQGNAYKKPLDAIKDGFDGVAEHQIAVLAGIRAAFQGMMERFDPEELEKRFEKQRKGSLIPGSSKAKNWEAFCNYYQELSDDMDDTFQHLFGDDFVRAYEDRLQMLSIERNKK